MAEAVVSFVVERLGDFIIQEGEFLYGVNDQVELAKTELRFMKGFLKDADARQEYDETIVRIWVAEVRDVAYDLEDVVEIYVLKVANRREGGFMTTLKRFGCMFKEGVNLHQIGSEIQRIRTHISTLMSRLETYNIIQIRDSRGDTSAYERQQQLRRTYSHIIERDVVGLEHSVKELATHLVRSGDSHRVVSIWGMAGLGKTTLAKQVYRDNEVRQHFDCFAWVCISQRFQVRDVWEEILVKVSALERKEIAQMMDGEIAAKLYLVQQENKCLVVLDDIWTIGTWESLKAAFPLYSRTFTMMKKLGKKMLQPCAGLPLAITVLAGLLARKETVDEWDMVHKNVCAYIRRGEGHKQENKGALWLLALSYDDLPYHLKPCFLYLGHFPEDFEIPVKRLTQLWIAEGFISASQERMTVEETMEDVAYGYLNELVERCVLQISEQGSLRKIKSCHLHDLMRDLCLEKVKQENFLQISSSMIANAAATVEVRRLAIYLDENADELVPLTNHKDSHLRSLLYFYPGYYWILRNEKLVGLLFKKFKLLRVLKLEWLGTPVELPNEIGNMVHLRFLSLYRILITRYPSSLGKLICLQTLNLRFCDSTVVPDVLWKMTQLRHLYLPLYWTAEPKLRLSTLHNLQTLNHVSSLCSDLNDLSELRNLRKLGIRVTSSLEMYKQHT
ncbi:hypothetical protein ACLB2K_034518 [Fragaria x ananassa]